MSRPTRVVAVVAVFLGAAFTASVAGLPDRSPASPELEISYVTDFRDDRRLAAFADDVFVGTVRAQVGTAASSTIPQTQFAVTVVQAVKGDLSGEVVVNQQGGTTADGRVVTLEQDELLVAGRTYLFATRAGSFGHTLVPMYGDLPVTSPAGQAELVARFTKAVAAQIAFAPGG